MEEEAFSLNVWNFLEIKFCPYTSLYNGWYNKIFLNSV